MLILTLIGQSSLSIFPPSFLSFPSLPPSLLWRPLNMGSPRLSTKKKRGRKTLSLKKPIFLAWLREPVLRGNSSRAGRIWTSLVVQWLRLGAHNAGTRVQSLVRTRSHMPQLKVPCVATKTQHSQINKSVDLKKKKQASCNVGLHGRIK